VLTAFLSFKQVMSALTDPSPTGVSRLESYS
jgi:hypothetical protein